MKMPEGKFIATVKVGEKGQIVIPKGVRDIFDINPGDTLLMLADKNQGIAIVQNDVYMNLPTLCLRLSAARPRRRRNERSRSCRIEEKLCRILPRCQLRARGGEDNRIHRQKRRGKDDDYKIPARFRPSRCGRYPFFSMPFAENEMKIKSRLGVVLGGVNYYPQKRLGAVAAVTSRFYPEWDDSLYRKYMQLFSLDESKRISELSAGMKVKFPLALALSHSADLLILDEPTSGLDPVSRDEILDIFISLSQDEGKTVFCSTHITSDLDRCADNIIYLKQGRIAENEPLCTLLQKYSVVQFLPITRLRILNLSARAAKKTA